MKLADGLIARSRDVDQQCGKTCPQKIVDPVPASPLVEQANHLVGKVHAAKLRSDPFLAHETGQEARNRLGDRILAFREDVGMGELDTQGISKQGGHREPVRQRPDEGGIEKCREQSSKIQAADENHPLEGQPRLECDEKKAGTCGRKGEDADMVAARGSSGPARLRAQPCVKGLHGRSYHTAGLFPESETAAEGVQPYRS